MDQLTHLDLCTGLGGWKEPFEESTRWRSIGVDIRADLDADVVGDIRNLPVDCSPTLVTMSPPCGDFARWMLPWLDEQNPSMELVNACFSLADELEPEYWVLENSRGLKQYTGRQEAKRAGGFLSVGEFPGVRCC